VVAVFRNTMGTGVQKASNQAVYLDDQMSGWTIENNSFIDCQVGSFIGGGRRNIVRHNNYVKCDTAQHIDNRGMNWEKGSDTCNDVSPPFKTTCNPGAAQWMITKGPASALWRKLWPELEQIQQDHLGLPARNVIANNTFCDCGRCCHPSENKQNLCRRRGVGVIFCVHVIVGFIVQVSGCFRRNGCRLVHEGGWQRGDKKLHVKAVVS